MKNDGVGLQNLVLVTDWSEASARKANGYEPPRSASTTSRS